MITFRTITAEFTENIKSNQIKYILIVYDKRIHEMEELTELKQWKYTYKHIQNTQNERKKVSITKYLSITK